jgi:glycosyltransferase involved in cell wall biosynthesis
MNTRPQYTPLVSIVIPVKNGGRTLDHCLRSIRRSSYKNVEVIVVDDHSTDSTGDIARRYTCTLLGMEDAHGANNARNFGAARARGEVLVFVDADIVIGRETILGVVETLEEDSVDAVVGIYTARHRHESLVSQYKNLWVRYSYIKSPPEIDWLFGSVSGIKREAFEKIGGFNVELLAKHGHDDIELGKRFARAKLNIILNMDIEVEHLKYYTLASFIKNEYHRSAGFAELAFRFRETARSFRRGFVNVYPAFILSTVISVIVGASVIASAAGVISPWYAAAAAVCYLAVNIRFLNYLEQVRGLFAMVVMIPFLFIDHIVCLAGSVAGALKSIRRTRDRR